MTKHHRLTGILLAVAFCLSVGQMAHAVRVDLNVFHNPHNVDTSFLDLWVDVTANGDNIDFTFYNDSTGDATITDLYFEQGLESILDDDSADLENSPGTFFFLNNLLPFGPPGGGSVGWGLFGAINAHQVLGAGIDAGVGEFVTVSFETLNGATLNDVLGLLGTDGRIAANVSGFESFQTSFFGGGNHHPSNVSVITDGHVVPLPAAAWLGLAMLGGMGAVRQYRRQLM